MSGIKGSGVGLFLHRLCLESRGLVLDGFYIACVWNEGVWCRMIPTSPVSGIKGSVVGWLLHRVCLESPDMV